MVPVGHAANMVRSGVCTPHKGGGPETPGRAATRPIPTKAEPMKRWMILRAAAAAAVLAGSTVAAQAQALNWGSHVYTFADCDPSSSSSGQSPGGSKSCDTAEASAQATTTFTSMKAAIRVASTAPAGDYHAGNIIQDALIATPTDTRLAGTAGTVRFSVAFDGQMSAQTDLYFAAYHAKSDPVYGSTNLSFLPLTTDFFGAPEVVTLLRHRAFRDTTVDAMASWELPVVFGSRATYQIGWTINAYAAGALADFSHTWTLVGLQAFDAHGQALAANFAAASGAVLPASVVPEPQALLLMLVGLGGLALAARRRR